MARQIKAAGLTSGQAAARAAYDAAAADYGAARRACEALGYDPLDEQDSLSLELTDAGSDALDWYFCAVDDTEIARLAWLASCGVP
ncbi:MAG: hypothetical protein WC211_00790 [Dehalococcoidia bacterium]